MNEPTFVQATHNGTDCIIQVRTIRVVYVDNANKTIVEFIDGTSIEVEETAEDFIAEAFE